MTDKENVKGDIMAFDVRTGKKKWVFHTIPRKGEPGYETWLNGSEEYTGNAGVWGPFSVDEELGYVVFQCRIRDQRRYGGHGPGTICIPTRLVCLDIRTGKMIWYHQLVHHDIWDYRYASASDSGGHQCGWQTCQGAVQLDKAGFRLCF